MRMTTDEQHLTAVLQRLATSVGRPLTPLETETALILLSGWFDLLVRGLTPEAVAAIARQEATTTTMH